jgi:hypothetical protein
MLQLCLSSAVHTPLAPASDEGAAALLLCCWQYSLLGLLLTLQHPLVPCIDNSMPGLLTTCRSQLAVY